MIPMMGEMFDWCLEEKNDEECVARPGLNTGTEMEIQGVMHLPNVTVLLIFVGFCFRKPW